MTRYHVIVDDNDNFTQAFDGEPQINLTFEHNDAVYRVVTRAHDDHKNTPTLHAERI